MKSSTPTIRRKVGGLKVGVGVRSVDGCGGPRYF